MSKTPFFFYILQFKLNNLVGVFSIDDATLLFIMLICCWHRLQASQSGYAVDYVTQGAQGGFPGSFLNQNSQAGYSRFGTGNDFMSQVCSIAPSSDISLCLTFSYFTILSFFFNDLLTQTSVLILLCCRTIWLMDHRVYLLRLASMTPHKMMHHRATLVWQMPTNFSLRFLLIPMLFSGGSLYVELFCFWVSS